MADKNWFAANAPTAAPAASGTDWFAANAASTPPPEPKRETDDGGNAFTRWLKRTWEGTNPVNLGQMLPFPKAAGGSGWDNPFNPAAIARSEYPVQLESEARWRKGDYPGAVAKYFEANIPFLGPLMSRMGNDLEAGRYAEAAGDTTALTVNAALPHVLPSAARVASVVPDVTNVRGAMGATGEFLQGPVAGNIAEHGVFKGVSKAAIAPSVEAVGRFLQRRGGRGSVRPGESLPGYPRVTETEAQPAPTPVQQPGESLPGYPRVTETEAPAAPTPIPQPGESLPGYPRVTETEAPAAPTPIPQPGESLPGYPRVTETEAQAAPTPVLQPGESLPGYPRGTVTPAPSIVETLTQRSGAPRAVGRPLTMTENLQSRVAEGAAPEITPEIAEEGWITPDETLQSVGAPTPTGGRGFWTGLRRGDLWPQLQEELLSTAEGPAAPKPRGRTGPDVRDARGRLKKK